VSLGVPNSDSASIATLSANTFTLPAGTYEISAWSVGFQVNGFGCRLYNQTNSTVVSGLIASPGTSPAAATWSERSKAELAGRFTLAGTTTLRLEQYSAAAKATTGFGAPIAMGSSEVFAFIDITKIA
jgi:hypothetical protein